MSLKFIQKMSTLWEKFIQNRPVYKKLCTEHERTKSAFNLLSVEHDKSLLEQDALSKKYKRAIADLDEAQGDLNTLHAEHKRTTADLVESHQKYNALQEEHERTTTALAKARHNLNKLSEEHNQIQADLAEARAEHKRTTADFNKLSGEYDTLSQKYKLVSDLLAAKPGENEKFEKFKKLFKKDFMDFANKESSLAEEAYAVQRLQRLEKHLEDIVAFPHTFTKKSIAIGGGYSSGKSEFVNSFITQSDIKLPVGIRPVTAIPSFVISSPEVSIKGFSSNGATVDIEPKFYRQLSHDFIKTLSFKLKDIMPYMAVEVPLKEGLFENIYLIDTPGYNPAGEITTEDRRTATDFLKDRDALIWMIGLDANNTIPKSDLGFIRDIEPSVPFYVVLNKAELRLTELKNILENVKGTLEDEGIKPIGISAYSAKQSKEYLSDGMSLNDFFLRQNQSDENIEEALKGQIENVFAMYKEAIDKDEKEANSLEKKLNSLALDLLQFGMSSTDFRQEKLHDKIEGQIEDIQESQKRDFTPITEQMKEIETNMIEAVDEIFWSLRSQNAETMPQPLSTPKPNSKKSTVRRQGYIRGEKYIRTDDEQSEKPAFANPQPHFDPRDFQKKPKKSKRVYEVAYEFNLSSTEMIALLRNLGFQVKDHMSVCTPVMAEAVQRELGAERQNNKKNTGATKRIGEVAREFNLSSSTMLTLLRNLGFKSRSPRSICTQEMVEAVQRELDTERQAKKKSTQAASQTQELININQATAKELERLLGIGPKIAKRIVAYRKQNGLFQRIDDLINVRGISLKILRALRSTLEWNLIDVLRQAKK